MKKITDKSKSEGIYTLNFEPGDEVMAGLVKLAEEEDIKAGHITGLGACGRLVLAYYNLETKEYEKHEVKEDVEILSLTGNIGRKGDETVVHLHGVFGRRDLSTFGGHIFEMVVSGAGEIHVTKLDGVISRDLDEQTGLNLMCQIS